MKTMNAAERNIYFNREERKALLLFLFICFSFLVYKYFALTRNDLGKTEYSIYDGLFEENQSVVAKLDSIHSLPDLSSRKAKVAKPNHQHQPPSKDTVFSARVLSSMYHRPVKDSLPYAYRQPISKNKVIVDLNTATEVELQFLPGIGPSFASRIIKYRNILGGFYHVNQLTEVYGFDDEKLNKIRQQITLTDNLRKLDLNTNDLKNLKHPYVSYQQAKVIKAYREMHGPYTNVHELLNIQVLDSFFVERIKPYLAKEIQ